VEGPKKKYQLRQVASSETVKKRFESFLANKELQMKSAEAVQEITELVKKNANYIALQLLLNRFHAITIVDKKLIGISPADCFLKIQEEVTE